MSAIDTIVRSALAPSFHHTTTMPTLFLWKVTDGTHLSVSEGIEPLFGSGVRRIKIVDVNEELKQKSTRYRNYNVKQSDLALLEGMVFTESNTWRSVSTFLMDVVRTAGQSLVPDRESTVLILGKRLVAMIVRRVHAHRMSIRHARDCENGPEHKPSI